MRHFVPAVLFHAVLRRGAAAQSQGILHFISCIGDTPGLFVEDHFTRTSADFLHLLLHSLYTHLCVGYRISRAFHYFDNFIWTWTFRGTIHYTCRRTFSWGCISRYILAVISTKQEGTSCGDTRRDLLLLYLLPQAILKPLSILRHRINFTLLACESMVYVGLCISVIALLRFDTASSRRR